jgi:sugar phosphate isomerase/epimerase
MPELICSYYTLSGISPAGGGPSPLPFEARVRACAEAGYAGIGMHLRDYRALLRNGAADQDLAAILRAYGMRHVEVEFLRNWFADGEAGQVARRDEEAFYHMAEVFGARVMVLGGTMQGEDVIGLDAFTERFAALCARARERGVTVSMEPCVGTNVEDLDQALRVIQGAGAPNAGLCLDIWHLYRRGLDYARLRQIDPALVAGVQLGDAAEEVMGTLLEDCIDNRLLPGEGAAGAEAFVAALLDAGVTAPFSVEVVSKEQRERPLAEAAQLTYRAARAVIDAVEARRA